MKRYLLMTVACVPLLGACQKDSANDTTRTTSVTTADNTKVNERDKNNATVTPLDQKNSTTDVDISAQIRRSLMASDTLSTDAKNVKIVTQDGNVVLRGPVKDAAERAAIENTAKNTANVKRVENDLDILH